MSRICRILPLLALLLVSGCRSEPPSRLEQAQYLFDRDQLEEAAALCEEMIAAGEDVYGATLLRGRIHFQREQYEAAIADYTAAIELEPQESQGYYLRAEAWTALEEPEKAYADRNLSAQLYPDAAITRQRLEAANDAAGYVDVIDVIEDADEDLAGDDTDADASLHPDNDSSRPALDEEDSLAEDSTDDPGREGDRESHDLTAPEVLTPLTGPGAPRTPFGDLAVPGSGTQGDEDSPQTPLTRPEEEGGALTLEDDGSTGGDGYHWNDYLQPGTAPGGTGLGGLPGSTSPHTGLGDTGAGSTPGTPGLSGTLPSTGLSSGATGPASGTGGGSGLSPLGLPGTTPSGGVTTGIISDPSELPNRPRYPITGPTGQPGTAPGVPQIGGPPVYGPLAQPGAPTAGAGGPPVYGPLAQPGAQQPAGSGTGTAAPPTRPATQP